MNSTEAIEDVRQHLLEVAHPLFLRKGFTAVGLTELLHEAGIPKGSFYYYFGSKEAFGEALLEAYFNNFQKEMDVRLTRSGTAAKGLLAFFQNWYDSFSDRDAQGRCLAVKLGAEVCDLSEAMRATLKKGTADVVSRLAEAIGQGQVDGSVHPDLRSKEVAASLYQTWLGASLLAKIARERTPLRQAMASTRQLLSAKRKG